MRCVSSLKTVVFALNGVTSLGGLAMLHIGIWLSLNHRGPVAEVLDVGAPPLAQRVAHAHYLCIAAGSFSALAGFMGCWGAARERKCLLGMVSLLMAALFLAELASAVLAFSTTADVFVAHLKTWALKTLKEDYGQEEDITAVWDATMKELECCGFHNYTDFDNSAFQRLKVWYDYPASCCRNGKSCYDDDIDHLKQGCLRIIQEFLKSNRKIVGAVCLGTGVLELAATVISLTLYGQIGTSP
ncbi:PREDICTED: tetraspanin-16 [Gekko japonicus]|uniref:Tetraspanin n=1 Tax=Gekko japonicus TaxID=146911 RepID=A0ABM1JHC6_GEKJA|nr:PREDICTED: tetraspanin-16 [Gekko japonicus]